MIKFPMIHIQDKGKTFDPVPLGSDKHHMMQLNEDGSLDFLNLQNHDMTGKFGDHCFAVDPDNEDLLPLVSFDTLMHEIEPLLELNDKDARIFGKAVAEINNLLDQAETKENKRLSEIIGQSVDVYLKNRDLAKLKKAKIIDENEKDPITPVKSTDVSVFDVAAYIIDEYHRRNLTINNLKLQKILFYVQTNMVQKINRMAFKEDMEMWQYGGCVPAMYYAVRKYVSTPIWRTDHCFDDAKPINKMDRKHIDEIIEKTLKHTDKALVRCIQATPLYEVLKPENPKNIHTINCEDLTRVAINL